MEDVLKKQNKLEDDLKKNGRQPKKMKKKKKTSSTIKKSTFIGCDIIVKDFNLRGIEKRFFFLGHLPFLIF
jgi:hypothetical protein